jgi:hypothetical protein
MAVAGTFPLQAAFGGASKTFGRPPVGFYFRHGLSSVQRFPLFKKNVVKVIYKKKISLAALRAREQSFLPVTLNYITLNFETGN